jgi:hypothetical protein
VPVAGHAPLVQVVNLLIANSLEASESKCALKPICTNAIQRYAQIETQTNRMKEILEINVDPDLGTTEVSLRVPQFQNFGQHLRELELKERKADQALDEPVDAEEIEETTTNLTEMAKTSLGALQQKLDAMPEGPQKEMLRSSMQMMNQMISGFGKLEDTEEDDEDEPGSEEDAADLEYDLQQLRIALSDDMAWDKAAEARVDAFLAAWPGIRPQVLQATFKYYKDLYPQLAEMFGESPAIQFIMPKPTSPDVIADLFYISAIYLHEDGKIGLGAQCTWDEEHGYGVLLKNNKVVSVGHEDEAFC